MDRFIRTRFFFGHVVTLRPRYRIHLQFLKNFKAFSRHTRQISGLNRFQGQVARQSQIGETPIIKIVRFRKRQKGFFNFLKYAGAAYLCCLIFGEIVLRPLGQALDDPELPEIPEEDINAIFIPFPLTMREVKQPPYSGSDPEWQEFVRFSKQPNLAEHIRRELADMVLQALSKNTILFLHVGKDMVIRRFWLDIDFPSNPPPEYFQSGIEIGNDYIAWTSHPVDSMTVRRIQRAFWPSSMTLSTWSFAKVVVADYITMLASLIGNNTESAPPLEQILAQHHNIVKQSKVSRQDETPSDAQSFSSDSEMNTIPSLQQPSSQRESDDEENDNEQGIQRLLTDLRQGYSGPLSAFKKTFTKSWKRPVCYPPRGSFSVSGLIEIDTSKAFLVFEVIAFWDPQTKSYDTDSLALGLKRIQLKKQVPRGGN
ncbi:hypothetical protein K3495_g2863 [Podosphaera aphanis]|nr:hypothetical protein K3495_g2863 [Podosphaera aphanis]